MNLEPSSALVSGVQLLTDSGKQPDINVSAGDKIPLVYGRNVYVPEATVLSHRIGVSGDRQRLVHYLVCLISLGQIEGFDTGEIVDLVPAVYSHGVRTGRAAPDTPSPLFIDWRQGLSSQLPYDNQPTRSYSYKVRTREATMPAAFGNGIPIINVNIFWQSANGLWNGQTVSPGDSVSLTGWSEWITLNTNESTAYDSFCTALVEQQSRDGDISRSDFLVRKGRSLKRIDYIQNDLQLTKGNSDRFPDVVYDIVRQTTLRADHLVDFGSFSRANSHVSKEGLSFGGIVRNADSVFNFVNTNSLFFDLIPTANDNRMGFIPNSVETVRPIRLFTNTNHNDFSYTYLDSYLHQVTSLGQIITDPLSGGFRGIVSNETVDTLSDASTTPIGSLTISAEQVMSDRSSVSLQSERIKKSINQQDEQISFITDSIANTVEPGDFILAHDVSIAVGRVYVGGISHKANIEGINNIFHTIQASFAYPLTIDSDVIDNKFTISNNFRLEVSAGDFVVFDITEQNSTGGVDRAEKVVAKVVSVSSVDVSLDEQTLTVTLDKKQWNNGDWETDNTPLVIPINTDAFIYKLATSTDTAIIDDYKSVYKTRAELIIVPIGDGIESCIRFFDYVPEIVEPIPVLIAPRSEISIWRVSSIEVKPTKDSAVRYKVCATIYEGFGSSLAIEEKTASIVVDKKDQEMIEKQESQSGISISNKVIDYPGYNFGYLNVDVIDSTEKIDNLDPVDIGQFTARAVTATGTFSDAGTGANESNNDGRPTLTQAQITSRYQDAVVRIDMRNGEHGTGFIVSSDGTIISNEHVANIASRITLRDGSIVAVKWYKFDEGNDIAIGKLLDPDREFVYCELSATSSIKTGDRVYAIGNSLPDFWGTTTSVIEQYGERCTPNQTTKCYRAADGLLEGGGSGSPIFNDKGLVVGMARAIAVTSAGEKDFFMEMSPIINRIYNEKLWIPPDGKYDIPSPIHTAYSGYTRQEAVKAFGGSAVSPSSVDTIYRDNPGIINKWAKKSISLSVSGIYSIVDKRNFSAYIDQINSVLPSGMSIETEFFDIGDSPPSADIYSYVIPKEQFDVLVSTYTLDYPSYSYVDTDGADTITSGYIIVPFDEITDARRARLFTRELYRVLGFVGSVIGSSNSVMDDSGLESEPLTNTLSPVDKQAIRLLYRPEFTPGMSAAVASAKLNRIQEV